MTIVHRGTSFTVPAAGPAAPYRMEVIDYVGDGQDNRVVNLNAAMDPDFLFVSSSYVNGEAYYKTKSTIGWQGAGGSSQWGSLAKSELDGIKDMGPGSFTLGTNTNVNALDRPYSGLAFQRIPGASSAMDLGVYTGTGSAVSVTGLSYQPDIVFVFQSTRAGEDDILNTTQSSLTRPIRQVSPVSIITFNPDGFTVNKAEYYANGVDYFWMTFDAVPDVCGYLRYSGTGTTRTEAIDAGATADACFIGDRGSGTGGDRQVWFRTKAQFSGAAQSNMLSGGGTGGYTDRIQDFNPGNIGLGPGNGVNQSGRNYLGYWWTEQGLI